MKCPFCQNPETKVLDSREVNDNIRRRRECLECEKRFTTYERHELGHISIVKKDGSRESFSRDKVRAGIMRAVEKRPVTAEQVEKTVNDIEAKLRLMDLQEIPSKEVGELVMKALKKLDQVAYVRFASVYKEFADIESFRNIMHDLAKK